MSVEIVPLIALQIHQHVDGGRNIRYRTPEPDELFELMKELPSFAVRWILDELKYVSLDMTNVDFLERMIEKWGYNTISSLAQRSKLYLSYEVER